MPNRPRSSGPVAEGIGLVELGHSLKLLSGARAKARRARRRRRPRSCLQSFTPGALSTPDDTSTPRAPVARIASATLSGVKPARQQPGPPRAETARRGASRTAGRCRRAGPRPSAAWRRSAACRRRRRRPRPRRGPAGAATPIAFIVGARSALAISATRAGLSRPCNCRTSGSSAAQTPASSASSASTRQRDDPRPAPAPARRARAPASRPTWRGLFGKNTKPTMSAPARSAASRVVGRREAADFDDGRHRRLFRSKRPPVKGQALGLTRRGLLSLPSRSRRARAGTSLVKSFLLAVSAALGLAASASPRPPRATRRPARPSSRSAGCATRSGEGEEFRRPRAQRGRRPQGRNRPGYNYSDANKNSGLTWDEAI